MFKIVTGPFQPVLESSLVAEIQKLKNSDPFTSLAIVVPSEVLRRRLQWLLCVEHGLALYDVYFLTFHQLALRLYDEGAPSNPHTNTPTFRLVSEMTLRQLLRGIIGRGLPGLEVLSSLRQSPGSSVALWSTIRDLKEALLDPPAVYQAIAEGVFELEAEDSLRSLFTLYAAMLETTQHLHIGSPDDLAALVIPKVPSSLFLSRLKCVCYYGFYDLTQVQLSLFEAVTQKAEVIVYSPLIDDPAFAFSQRFFDRHLSSGAELSTSKSSLPALSEPSLKLTDGPSVKVMNAVGAEDELTLVCKEVLNLIELHGYAFEEIGVVARSLMPYQVFLSRICHQHRIPFTTSALRPLIHEPAIKLLLRLANLQSHGFDSKDILDVLRSPFYRVRRDGMRHELFQPDLWQEVVQTMGITRGEDQWLRLYSVASSHVGESEALTCVGALGPLMDHGESIQYLSQLVQELISDCQTLPVEGRIGELTEAFMKLIRKHVVLPEFSKDGRGDQHDSSCDEWLNEAIQSIFDQLKQLVDLQETMAWEEWLHVFSQIVEECSIPIEPGPHLGVRVLDVMAARGLPFRAIFILGLNEKVFPRYIREDAFLRDRHRRVLAETLGYKIDEKLSGHDEERLLFALLQQAAKDRLYLSYQRADEEGRPLAPSSFIRELNRHEGLPNNEQELSLPRRFSDRLWASLFRDSLLTQEELVLKLIQKRVDPTILLEHFGQNPFVFQQGVAALAYLEGNHQKLGLFDGVLGPIEEHWQDVASKGISPTSLESYAQCPFRYLVSHMLSIRLIRNQRIDALPPSVIGWLCHEILRKVYAQLTKTDWPDCQSLSSSLSSLIESVVEEVFTTYATQNPTGYWVIWQLLKDMVQELVTSEVEASREEFVTNGFRSIAVEVEAEGNLKLSGVCPGELKIHGRLDRVEFRAGPEGFRIIDYKFKLGSQMKAHERDLLASGIRGQYLQPPLYTLMSEYRVRSDNGDSRHSFHPERVEFVYLAPNRDPMVERSVFDRRSWETPTGQQLSKTLTTLVKGIHAGEHFIFPGDYCDHCPVSSACRRFHRPTWRRAYRSEQAKQLRQIRKQEIVRD